MAHMKFKSMKTSKLYFFIGLTTISTIFFFTNLSLTKAEFLDVKSNNPFFDAINYMQSQGVINGYEDNTYKPNNPINRAEFVKIIVDTIFTKDQLSDCKMKKRFFDVSKEDWFYPYICIASNNGIINGYADRTFAPSNYINFSEASKIIVNAFGYETSPKDFWYQSFIEKLEGLNAIPRSICSILKNISRGEMAEMIYRLKEKITNKNSNNFFSENAKTIETAQTTTFIKSYRIKEKTDSYGIAESSDGGYVITGDTVNPNEMKGYSMFWFKADSNGDKQWSKIFDNGSSDGYAVTELTDGNYVVAGQVAGEFRTVENQLELEGQGDNFVIKLDKNGNQIWVRTVSQQSIDLPSKLFPSENGGFIMSGSTGVLVGHPDIADINHTLFLGNFNTDGDTNWFKKIDSDEIMTKSVEPTDDGGYILIGSIKLKDEDDQTVPALVKLKSDGTYEWATGLENLPIEVPNLIISPDKKSYTVGTPKKFHLDFANFFEAEQTNDGGFIAFGNYTQMPTGNDTSNLTINFLKTSNIVAVKLDQNGKLKWARTVSIKKYLEDTVIEKAKDGGYIIMGNNLVGGYLGNDERNEYSKMLDEYYEKFPPMTPETPESKKAMDEISDYIEKTESPLMSRNIILVKTDANFNYQWGKVIGGTKDLDGYAIISTTDFGYAITGTWHTGIKYKILGTTMEYTEAMIMKLDANGNLGNNNGLVSDFTDAEENDVSPYIVTNQLNADELITEYPMENIIRTIKIADKKGVNTIASESQTYEVQFCEEAENDDSSANPITKTRPEIKYEDTKEVEVTSEKGKIINDELLPILKEIFNDEVKVWDDFEGICLAYRFKRLVTEQDINEITQAMQELGYNIASDANKDFTATKIGMTLNFHFMLGDTNTGQVELTY